MNEKILIVDDESKVLFFLDRAFSRENIEVIKAGNGKDGLQKIRETVPDVILTDYKMPEMNGIEFIKAIKALYDHIPVIVMTAAGDKDTSIEFLQQGAFHYIEKPFSIVEMKLIIKEALKQNKLLQDNKKLHDLVNIYNTHTPLIGTSKAMQEISSLIKKVANTDATVLLTGESGTGKGLIAREIHRYSPRNSGPFVSFNCASIPDSLAESELFGYKKGAFTGAEHTKPGRFGLADKGTLFLDEVGEINQSVQAKLLRAIQDKEYEFVGGTKTLKTDTRIIAATNQNLENMVKNKRFREDLYYRLNVFPIRVPPLRERGEDILLLANYFMEKYAQKYDKQIKGFSSKAIQNMQNYPWHGNIRELENIISRAIIICTDGIISDKFLPLELGNHNSGDILLKKALAKQYTEEELTKIYAKKIYEQNNYSKKETCKILGINYRTLMKRLS